MATPHNVGAGIAGAALGFIGNPAIARYMFLVGRRIGSATPVADACFACWTSGPLRPVLLRYWPGGRSR
jgi:hypothetical protein